MSGFAPINGYFFAAIVKRQNLNAARAKNKRNTFAPKALIFLTVISPYLLLFIICLQKFLINQLDIPHIVSLTIAQLL